MAIRYAVAVAMNISDWVGTAFVRRKTEMAHLGADPRNAQALPGPACHHPCPAAG